MIRYRLIFPGIFFMVLPALSARGQNADLKQIRFKGDITLKGQSVPAVKLELTKNGEVVKTSKSSTNGSYEILIDINSTDESDADYTLTFTKVKMLPKTVSINTFIEKPTVRYYNFNLDVEMVEQKADDIIIDLPSASIKWSEGRRKFMFDQTEAKTVKKEKKIIKEDSLKNVDALKKKPDPVDVPLSVLDNDRKKEIQDSILKTYQKGITEEVFEEPSYVLTKRTVVSDGRVVVYYKKAWNWGGVFFFKDEYSTVRSISENTYNLETVGVK